MIKIISKGSSGTLPTKDMHFHEFSQFMIAYDVCLSLRVQLTYNVEAVGGQEFEEILTSLCIFLSG